MGGARLSCCWQQHQIADEVSSFTQPLIEGKQGEMVAKRSSNTIEMM